MIGIGITILSRVDKRRSLDFLALIQDPYKILKIRLAKGDIDEEKYDKLKKKLDGESKENKKNTKDS